MTQAAPSEAPLAADPRLDGWLRPEHLDPAPVAAQAMAQPVRYAVLDNAFTDEALARFDAGHAGADFQPDNEGTNYDSLGCAMGAASPTGAFLRSSGWLAYASAALGVNDEPVKRNIVSWRRHTPDAKGFWPHIDHVPSDPKRITGLIYLSPDWREGCGGELQLWTQAPPPPGSPAPLRWDDWRDRRLDFLDGAEELIVELGGPAHRPPLLLRKVASIAPVRNRVVLLPLRTGLIIHSVTASNDWTRDGVLQWIE